MRIATRTRHAAVTMAFALVACAAVTGVSVETSSAAAPPPAPVATERLVPGGDSGVMLNLDQKKLATLSPVPEGKVVLFLEPFGVPTAKAFDVPGLSWMDSLSKAGYDTWALDVRGFGKSTRAPAMDQPPMANPPMTSTAEAVRDVDAAVRYITAQRGVTKVSLVGWSWGGTVAGAYAAEHPSLVDNLVLYGAMNAFSMEKKPFDMLGLELTPGSGVLKKLPAYALAEFDKTSLGHWNLMMDSTVAGRALATAESIDAVRKVFMASDSTTGDRNPPSIRRAMGPMVDLYDAWTNKAVFDASKITAPVLVIRGDADFFADPNLIGSLTGASYKREVVIPDATHWMLYEQHRDVLLNETQALLERVAAPGAPTGVTAVPGNGQAVVSWTPSTSGGAATSYRVTASPGGTTVTTTGTTATVTGLANGTNYTFKVTAVNSAGTAVSAASAAVTPSAASPAVDPRQVVALPVGAPATGDGSTAGSGYSPLVGLGLALFLCGAAAVPAIRRRQA